MKYTQDDVAKELGMNKSTIQRYETGGVNKIKLPVIEAIAKYLNVNPMWLIGKSENKEPLNDKYHKIEKEQKEIRSPEDERILQLLSESPEFSRIIDIMITLSPAERASIADYATFRAAQLEKEHQK